MQVTALDYRPGPTRLSAGQPVPHGLLERIVLLKPSRRATVQGDGLVLPETADQLGLQELGEQVVVAEPLPDAVERADEEVAVRDGAQQVARRVFARDRAAESGREPLEDRGPQEERRDLRRLLVEHLARQIAGDVAAVAADPAEDLVGRGLLPGERGQRDTGHPPLCRLCEAGDRHVVDGDPVQGEEVPRLVHAHGQIGRTELEHPSGGAHARERQRRVLPAAQADVGSRGAALPQARR